MSGSVSKDGVTEQGRNVADHWARLAVNYAGVLDFLKEKGIAVDNVTPADLHSIDMIHMGGLQATDELALMAGIDATCRVLDVGSGVGGPARKLASRYGANVSGLELSETLCETATKLAELVGLQEKARFIQGSALALPYPNGEFDVVIIQHVAMQISEKTPLFGELTRVIKPGGTLALHEIFSGAGELHYPLAWANEPGMSALEPLDTCVTRLSDAGFEVGTFIDHSDDGRAFHAANIEACNAALDRGRGMQGLSPDVVRARLASSLAMEKNLRTGALRVGMMVARKPA